MPPLRERGDDVLELADHFLGTRVAAPAAAARSSSTAAARELLAAYDWPGNVRELQNIITRACVLNQGQPIRADELRPWLAADRIRAHEPTARTQNLSPPASTLEEVERRLIETTLGPVRRSSREDGRSPRHRPPHAERQAAAVRLRTAGEELCQGRLTTRPAKAAGCKRQKLPIATATLFENESHR